MAKIYTLPTKDKRPYLITFDKGERSFQRIVKLANSWSEAFLWALEQKRVVSCIQPLK